MMRGRSKRKYPKERRNQAVGTGLDPGSDGLDTPIQDKNSSIYDPEKVYLGVRVKMPVKDLLRNIRVAQGWGPGDFQKSFDKTVKGEKKRVQTRKTRQKNMEKMPTKSLEELEIIVEVLEEDLQITSSPHSTSTSQSLPFSNSPTSREGSPPGAGYHSDESDEIIPSPQSFLNISANIQEYHKAKSPSGFMHNNLQLSRTAGRSQEWLDSQNHDWNLNSSTFFWVQLQKEEIQLSDISDAVLLSTDDHGRTALHKVACVGKRALGYCMAKRMATLNSLDLRDCDGMTALLYAAKYNQYLMVADLIRWGADVNATNNAGKSCLHLSAERGYVRVLEVLKYTMLDGVFVDVEAIDNSGMSVLQCASLALKATVRELENSKSPRLHTLCQEQMMETLEYLLQMGSYLHTMGNQSAQSMIY
ncbi:NF-kappa-B inhibitor zeta [Antennarius striatus]|uniref:NF-kappa-B inhibitor zeta n=1 Tax=Antennarius striatus TaxID=241820 RepID=UPI0035AF4F14